MKYQARALAPDQTVTSLFVEAVDELDARRLLGARGLYVMSLARAGGGLPWRGTPRAVLPLVLFSQELLALLEAGLGIVESIEALFEKESNAALRGVFARLLASLHEGKRFSAALAEQGSLFPPLYLGVVRAAEGTSDLPRSLQRFIDYQQRIDAVRAKVVSAAIYPSILITVGGLVSLFLMMYVVPRFAEVYQGAGRQLPWMSALLLVWGQFAKSHAGLLALVLGGSGLVIALGWRRFKASGGWGLLLARLPAIGERVRIYELSRLYLTLGMLLEGGITLIAAMETVREVVSPQMRGRLLLARGLIEAGVPLSEAFERHGLTTSISLRMLIVGERSGEMGAMLTRSAAFYDGEITRWIDRFMRSFEPILMAAIGLVVGVIVVLLYMPIFDLAGSF